MKPELSVVVPILGYDSIGTFMQTLQVAWSKSIEVIVLDSTPFGKRHDTVNYDQTGKSTIIRAIIDPPMSYYDTLNMGVRMARGEYIAICHDDVLFGYKSIENCVDYLNEHEHLCVFPDQTVGPMTVEAFEQEGKKVAEQPMVETDPSPPPWVCTVFYNDVFNLIGEFDTRFEQYFGGRDFWYRLIKAGHPPRLVSNALVHHYGGRTTGAVWASTGKDYRVIMNQDEKRFGEKWGKTNSKQLLHTLRTMKGK